MLLTAPVDRSLVLGQPDADSPLGAVARRRRLAELGLRPGASVRVVRRTAGGGRILRLGDARVAVSRDVAAQLPVTLEP